MQFSSSDVEESINYDQTISIVCKQNKFELGITLKIL